MTRLKHHYNTVIVHDLIENFEYSDVRSLPRLEKITLNCGLKYNNFNTKQIDFLSIDVEGNE